MGSSHPVHTHTDFEFKKWDLRNDPFEDMGRACVWKESLAFIPLGIWLCDKDPLVKFKGKKALNSPSLSVAVFHRQLAKGSAHA